MPLSLISFSGVVCVSIFIFCVVESSLFIFISFIRVRISCRMAQPLFLCIVIHHTALYTYGEGLFGALIHLYITNLCAFFFHYLDRIFAFVIGKILCRYSPHSCWRKNTTNFVKTFFPNQMIFLFSISIHSMLYK